MKTLPEQRREAEGSIAHFQIDSPQERRQWKAEQGFCMCQFCLRKTFNPAIPSFRRKFFHPGEKSLIGFLSPVLRSLPRHEHARKEPGECKLSGSSHSSSLS